MSGYDLFEVSKNNWILNVQNGSVHSGTLDNILKIAAFTYFIPIEELESAILSMLDAKQNSAHFGIRKTFMFGYNTNFNVSAPTHGAA